MMLYVMPTIAAKKGTWVEKATKAGGTSHCSKIGEVLAH